MIDSYINVWKAQLERKRASRNEIDEYKRLDMSERIHNFPDSFFNEFISSITQEDLITYPSHDRYDTLVKKISLMDDINEDQVHIVPGSDIAIRFIFELACQPGCNIISTNPSFPMYGVYAKMFQASFVTVNYRKDLKVHVDDILTNIDPATRVVVIANPNNPIGDWKDIDEIEYLCSELNKRNILLFVDEAYVAYSPGTCKELINRYANIIISRTFSKGLGAAGIRVGYVISNPNMIDAISRLRFTFPITNISTKFAIFLLEHSSIYESYILETVSEREYLAKKFLTAGFDVVNSHCNWIHVNDINNNQKIVKIFEAHDVSFKKGTKIPFDHRDNWVRLTVGPKLSETKFIKKVLRS